MNEKINTITKPVSELAPKAKSDSQTGPYQSPLLASPTVRDQIDADILAVIQAESAAQANPQPLPSRRIEIKARCGSFLRKLNQEQTNQLVLWLTGEHSVPHIQSLIAQPPPAGFGLQVQATTLRRIRATFQTFQKEDDYEESALTADALSETIEQNRVDFAPIISDLLLQKTFDLARNNQAASDLKEIVASFVRLRELDLKTRRLELLRAEATRHSSAKRHHVDLNIIPPNRPNLPNPPIEIAVLPRAGTTPPTD